MGEKEGVSMEKDQLAQQRGHPPPDQAPMAAHSKTTASFLLADLFQEPGENTEGGSEEARPSYIGPAQPQPPVWLFCGKRWFWEGRQQAGYLPFLILGVRGRGWL